MHVGHGAAGLHRHRGLSAGGAGRSAGSRAGRSRRRRRRRRRSWTPACGGGPSATCRAPYWMVAALRIVLPAAGAAGHDRRQCGQRWSRARAPTKRSRLTRWGSAVARLPRARRAPPAAPLGVRRGAPRRRRRGRGRPSAPGRPARPRARAARPRRLRSRAPARAGPAARSSTARCGRARPGDRRRRPSFALGACGVAALGLPSRLARLHVLGPAALVGAQRAVLDRERARADRVEQRAVVGHQQQRARRTT